MLQSQIINVLPEALQVWIIQGMKLRHGIRIERHLIRMKVVRLQIFDMLLLLLHTQPAAVVVVRVLFIFVFLLSINVDVVRREIMRIILLKGKLAECTDVLEETIFVDFLR